MIEIVETKPGDQDFYLFDNLPEQIYPADSTRFKFPEKIIMELLDTCFVLTDNGKPLARAALYNNPELKYQNRKAFTVGNYEAIDDLMVTEKLLTAIYSAAKKRGAEFIIGPMNGSTWYNYRFSTQHDHPNFFLEPYHHVYYNKQFTNSGFIPIANYFSSIDNSLIFGDTAVLKREQELVNMGVNFRSINLQDYKSELKNIYKFNSTAFKANFLYTPIAENDFIEKYADTQKLINPGFVILAEDADNNLIGYVFCIDNYFNVTEKSLIIKTIARHPDKKWAGLGHIMVDMINQKASAQNYVSAIHAFVYESGTSIDLAKKLSGKIYKNYILYGKEIN